MYNALADDKEAATSSRLTDIFLGVVCLAFYFNWVFWSHTTKFSFKKKIYLCLAFVRCSF